MVGGALRTIGLLAVTACQAGPQPAVSPASTADDTAAAWVVNTLPADELSEELGECDAIVPLEAHRHLCQRDEQVWLVDESLDLQQMVLAAQSISGAVLGSEVWVVADGATYSVDGMSLYPLALELPVPPEHVAAAGGRFWLRGAGRLFYADAGVVRELVVEGLSSVHAFAAAGSRVLLGGSSLLALRQTDSGWTVEWSSARQVESLTADESGTFWMVANGGLYATDGSSEPASVALPEAVRAVAGPSLWVAGESHGFHLAERVFLQTESDLPETISVDPLGRVLGVSERQAVRTYVGMPVAIVGMPDVLSVQTEVTLVPAQSASAEVVGVWMGQERLEVATEPFRVTLDPDGRVSGEHALRVLSALGDREGVHAESVWVGELPEVTWSEVEEIHDRYCAECHNGQTHTILDSKDAWRMNIDRIIEVVSSGEMPLGTNPIPDEDVVSVRAWKWGGFQ